MFIPSAIVVYHEPLGRVKVHFTVGFLSAKCAQDVSLIPVFRTEGREGDIDCSRDRTFAKLIWQAGIDKQASACGHFGFQKAENFQFAYRLNAGRYDHRLNAKFGAGAACLCEITLQGGVDVLGAGDFKVALAPPVKVLVALSAVIFTDCAYKGCARMAARNPVVATNTRIFYHLNFRPPYLGVQSRHLVDWI